MNNIQITVEELNKLSITNVVHHEPVRKKFIQIHDTIWGEGTGEAAYERESVFFNRLIEEKKDTYEQQRVTNFSVFTSFIDLAICGLTCEPGVRALCYLQGRRFKIGKDPQGKDLYEARLTLTISGYGELVLRARTGQIRHADNPVLVYEEDEFSFSDNNGQKQVSYTCRLPHKSAHIIACFIRITRADGSIDYGVMFEEDWLRLSEFSANQNKVWNKEERRYEKGEPNALYNSGIGGGIDTGFLKAKCIKHAFNTYPKVRIGRSTTFEADEPKIDDLYGVEEPAPATAPQHFAPTAHTEEGVTVQPQPQSDQDDGAF